MPYTFPTLSVGPQQVKPSPAKDPSLRSDPEDGVVISRRKSTANPRKFQLEYRVLPAADKVLLDAMQDAVGIGADTITWTNDEDPNDGATYTVRLTSPGIRYENLEGDYSFYKAQFTLTEA